jgi:hypothetical protein
LAQQLMKWEQLPTPPPQSASVEQEPVPQLHLQVLRKPAPDGVNSGTEETLTGMEKTLFSERSGITYVWMTPKELVVDGSSGAAAYDATVAIRTMDMKRTVRSRFERENIGISFRRTSNPAEEAEFPAPALEL